MTELTCCACTTQRLCKRLLETRGHADVTLANDGDSALRLLMASYEPPAKAFDLCLMDMSMPVMDGLQATRQFRAFERRTRPSGERLPVVALSANVFDEAIEDCRAAGMDGFVPSACPRCAIVSLPALTRLYHCTGTEPLRIDMLRATLASTDIVI
jgi:CheY-like chemotaxis protein